jgi:hypothetical protein
VCLFSPCYKTCGPSAAPVLRKVNPGLENSNSPRHGVPRVWIFRPGRARISTRETTDFGWLFSETWSVLRHYRPSRITCFWNGKTSRFRRRGIRRLRRAIPVGFWNSPIAPGWRYRRQPPARGQGQLPKASG